MSEPRLAITGATGFLGSHLAAAFSRDGWDVTAIVRPRSPRAAPSGTRTVEAPLEAADIAQAAAGVSVIVHAAAMTRAADESLLQAVNVRGTEAVVEGANQIGARMLLISSQAATGTGTIQRPSQEDDPPAPVNAYGRSKIAAELVLRRSAKQPWLVVRPSAVYGPGDRQFLPLFRLAKRGWFPLMANPSAAFTFLYVEDLVRAILLAARRLNAQAGESRGLPDPVFFLGHHHPHEATDVLRQLAAALNRPYRPTRVPGPAVRALASLGDLSWRFGMTPDIDSARLAELTAESFVCSVDRARAELGFSASIDLQEGFDRTARWYAREGWL